MERPGRNVKLNEVDKTLQKSRDTEPSVQRHYTRLQTTTQRSRAARFKPKYSDNDIS